MQPCKKTSWTSLLRFKQAARRGLHVVERGFCLTTRYLSTTLQALSMFTLDNNNNNCLHMPDLACTFPRLFVAPFLAFLERPQKPVAEQCFGLLDGVTRGSQSLLHSLLYCGRQIISQIMNCCAAHESHLQGVDEYILAYERTYTSTDGCLDVCVLSIHLFTHACYMYLCMYSCTWLRVCASGNVCESTPVSECMSVNVCKCAGLGMRICVCICICICICTCMHMCIYESIVHHRMHATYAHIPMRVHIFEHVCM